MLVRPEPFPDEVDRGYLGRFMRLNGTINPERALALAASWIRVSRNTRRKLTKVEILSELSGLDLPRFACDHTMLPLRRAIALYDFDVPHGDDARPGLLRNSALRVARPGAYFCGECEDEDRYDYGTSYWRRSLQIPGQYWCPIHRTPLFYRTDSRAFLSPPSRYFRHVRRVSAKWVKTLLAQKAHEKALSIALALMKRDTPFNGKRVMEGLKWRALSQGFHFEPKTTGLHLFAETVLDAFNANWLRAVLPTRRYSTHDTVRTRAEGLICPSRGVRTTMSYAMTASLLCERVDDALAAFAAASEGKNRRPRCQISTPRPEDYRLHDAYLRHGGDHQAIVTDRTLTARAIPTQLSFLGLPDLAEGNGAVRTFAFAFFVGGKSLTQSKRLSGISACEVERILRAVTVPFANTLTAMNASEC